MFETRILLLFNISSSNLLFIYSTWQIFYFSWSYLQDSNLLRKKKKLLQLYFARISMSFQFRSSHQRCSIKTVFLKILQNSQEITCARVSFLKRLQASGTPKNTYGGCFLNTSVFQKCLNGCFSSRSRKEPYKGVLWNSCS